MRRIGHQENVPGMTILSRPSISKADGSIAWPVVSGGMSPMCNALLSPVFVPLPNFNLGPGT